MRRVLEPEERFAEVLFGLIMVLTFTGSLHIAEAGRDDVRTMLIGALGCNLAWGIIDGVLYVMASPAERGRDLATLRAVDREVERGILVGFSRGMVDVTGYMFDPDDDEPIVVLGIGWDF